MTARSILFAAVGAVSLAGCATTPEPKDFTAYNAEMPRSILVVPVVNHSNEVDAADLSTRPSRFRWQNVVITSIRPPPPRH
jgi:hypothetical protein